MPCRFHVSCLSEISKEQILPISKSASKKLLSVNSSVAASSLLVGPDYCICTFYVCLFLFFFHIAC